MTANEFGSGFSAATPGLRIEERVPAYEATANVVLHFLVQGRVQGVGFRWFVHREASELDLHGWVRNTEDGDVEVVVAGGEESLDELRGSLKKGPRGSRVDRVIEHPLAESEAAGLSAFKIEGAW